MPRPAKVRDRVKLSADDRATLRSRFIQNKELLKKIVELTNGNKLYELLAGAELAELNLVGYICHLVCCSAIPISRANFALLCHHRRQKVLADTFGSVKAFKEFEEGKRDEKLKKLRLGGIGVTLALKSLFERLPSN